MSRRAVVDMPEHLSLRSVRDAHIDQVLTSVSGNMTSAAKILRISRRTLYRMLEGRKVYQKV